MGVGTNRINRYTIEIATQGVANYLQQGVAAPRKVFISYDNSARSNSELLY